MTNTYLTGNALGSTSPKDLYDNASNFDDAMNSPSPSFIDRFNKRRETWAGMEEAFNAFLINAGYEFIGDYDADGPLTITQQNQVFSKDGEYWRSGPALALPYVTADNWAIDEPKFVSTGDASLRQTLATTAGAAMVGTASGDTVQETLDLLASSGVLISGGSTDKSTDDTAAVIAALATGRRIIGDPAKWYGINALTWPSVLRAQDVRFYLLNPDPIDRVGIRQDGGAICELVRVTVDRNGTGAGGQMNSSAAIHISNCQSIVRIEECEVIGNNFGDGIRVDTSTVKVNRNYVHDMTWGTPAGPSQTDDRMQGIFLLQCTGEFSFNTVARLYGQWTGQVPTKKFTRGYALAGCYDMSAVGNRSEDVDQGYDYSGGLNNRRITTVACAAVRSGSWGFKAANTVIDSVYSGCTTYQSGLAGFVASSPSTTLEGPPNSGILTQNITYVGCTSISNGYGTEWAGNGQRGGFAALNSVAYPEFPRGIKWLGCRTYGSGNSQYGFRNDVPVPASSTFWNEAINCDSEDSVVDFTGINQGSLIRAGAADQSIPSATPTTVALDSLISDRMNSGSTNIVRRSGLYLLNGHVNFSGNASGTRNLKILINGVQVQGGSYTAPANASGTGVGGSFPYRFSAGDTVRMEVNQDSGATLNLTSAFLAVTELLQGQG